MQAPLSFASDAGAVQLKLSPTSRTVVGRFARYGSVSVVSTLTSLSVLGFLVGLTHFSAIWANVVAVGIGTVPSFALNRRWVWTYSGRRSLRRQVLPYCLLSFAALLVSTGAVHFASDATATSGRLVHTAAVEIANLGSYGVFWLVQFLLCDRILFKDRACLAERFETRPCHRQLENEAFVHRSHSVCSWPDFGPGVQSEHVIETR
jgi:putative flippase GtrA